MKKKSALSLRQILFLAAVLLAFSSLTLFLFQYKKDEKRFTNITSRLFTEEMTSSTLNMHYSIAHPSDFGIYDYDAVLPGYDADTTLKGQFALENTIAALRSVRAEKLNASDAYLCTLLTRYLDNSMALGSFRYYSEPLAPSAVPERDVGGEQNRAQQPVIRVSVFLRIRRGDGAILEKRL